MNTSWDPSQNYHDGDRWSPDWCSDTKIPLFLDLRAPPVANGASAGSIGKRMLKLTSTYEGLSFGLAKKKTLTEVTIFFGVSQNQILKTLFVRFSGKSLAAAYVRYERDRQVPQPIF